MADEAVRVTQQQTNPIKIIKWKIRQGVTVPIGRIILIYEIEGAEKPEQKKLKSTQAGIIHKILVKEGNVVQPGELIYEIRACSHPTIMNDMCAECGTDLRKDDSPKSTASVPMIHAIPELKVSEEQAQKLGKADNDRLLKDRKLVLLVDLDQTLIHTTNDNIPPNIKDVYHFQLYGPKSPWYHTRLRPGTHKFLNSISDRYELHICTFGARNYAHMIAMFLDPDHKFFSTRILSRDECFDPTSKKANLRALFPCGDDMVCIIDDREDVWSHAANLIHVKPYHFFQHTGDINAPPGLDKHENDDKEGVDLTKIVNHHSKEKADAKEKKSEKEKQDLDKDNLEEAEEKNSDNKMQVLEKDNLKELKENENNVSASKEVREVDTEKSITADNVDFQEEKDKVGEECNEGDKMEEDKDSLNEQKQKDNQPANKMPAEGNKNDESKSAENGIDTESTDSIDNKISISNENKNANNNEDVAENEEDKNNKEKQTENIEKDTDKTETESINPTENNGKLKSVNNVSPLEKKDPSEDNLIEIEDPDDYLVYLEDVLTRIHKNFYEQFDVLESGKIPDLKKIIPNVRGKVLKGCKLIFSGLVPTHYTLEQSKAYQVARGLGAEVQADLDGETTHLVAVRPGTAKVNAGRRKKNLKIVTPDWLWCCAERWEHVDERIFPLNSKGSKNRHPPPHCSSPEHVSSYPEHETPALRKRTPSGRFMDTINPLMSFSSDDIADMDKEVEDILDDESDDSEEEQVVTAQADIEDEEDDENDAEIEDVKFKHMLQTEILSTYDKSTNEGDRGDPFKESESEEEKLDLESEPDTFKRKRPHTEDESSQEEVLPSCKFRRGEDVDDELDVDLDPDDNDSDSFGAPDESDDGEWNMMGAALEREFLSD